MAAPEEPTYLPTPADPVRVLLVEDSAVVRAFLRRFIESDPEMKVVATAGNGQRALDILKTTQVDVVVLDLEMPVMDGLTALPHIIAHDPRLQVVVASTLTKENAVISMKCLQAGAAECLAKPMSHEMAGSALFRDNLVQKVKTLGTLTRKRRDPAARRIVVPPPQSSPPQETVRPAAPMPVFLPQAGEKKIVLRQELVKTIPDAIAIASSTGGPPALLQFFSDLKKPLKQPVFITQHMPATFTAILAEHIQRATKRITVEAQEGMPIQPERIYVAPGDWHMTVRREGRTATLHLDQNPPENFCRPAVDPMLRSIAASYGPAALAIILTGMGHDGAKGARALVAAGGAVIAQDQATSVVWGMPQAAARAGVCSAILPLDEIAPYVSRLAMRHAA